MEGQNNEENPLQMMSFNSGGTSNHVCRSAEDDPNPLFVDAAAGGRNGSQYWSCLPEPFHNYVEYLTETSAYLPKTITEYALGSSYPPVNGVNGNDRNLFYNDPGKACGFKPSDYSTDIEFRKVWFWKPDNEDDQAMKFASNQHDLRAESHASWTAELTKDKNHVSQLDPTGFLLKPRSSSSRQKSSAADRQRRQRIADNLKALHDLLPTTAEGSQAYILDDIIDYVKYLQLQVKELSRSRLQGESTAMPLTFREGYGHYNNQQMLNEPLEEMMGKLLEEHQEAAAQLLESKGLFLLPMALVEDLRQAMQMFGGIPHV